MNAIPAVYEKGLFRPINPVEMPEGTRVQVVIPEQFNRANAESEPTPAQLAARRRVFEILSHRYDGGDHDSAERHNEHQP